jgi:hypothetical protein
MFQANLFNQTRQRFRFLSRIRNRKAKQEMAVLGGMSIACSFLEELDIRSTMVFVAIHRYQNRKFLIFCTKAVESPIQ